MRYSFFLSLLLLVSCNKTPSITDQVKFHDDGLAKPKVAVVKVFDSSVNDLEWDLSSEFTEFLLERLFSSSKFFLTDDYHMLSSNQLQNLELSPYSDDIKWLSEMNNSSEFILFTEIISHKITKKESYSYNPIANFSTLSVSVRVCVLDIRKDSPQIILQDVIEKEYTIPFNLGSYKDDSSSLTKNTFTFSPLGRAHKNIINEISKEIEDYILIAQTSRHD